MELMLRAPTGTRENPSSDRWRERLIREEVEREFRDKQRKQNRKNLLILLGVSYFAWMVWVTWSLLW